jgi:hypothetical protein
MKITIDQHRLLLNTDFPSGKLIVLQPEHNNQIKTGLSYASPLLRALLSVRCWPPELPISICASLIYSGSEL